MFNKVIVAEDFDSISITVEQARFSTSIGANIQQFILYQLISISLNKK
jgi:hypothetical protein